MKKTHIVIVGGGFGGLSAAKSLAKNPDLKITLIDKNNYHLFQPLLYQVAMAGLSPAEIAYPLRVLLSSYKNVDILMGKVVSINKEEKYLETEEDRISFDYLILACGSTTSYFNSPEWEKFAPSLKSLQQATDIRRRVFLAFERAEREASQEEKKKLMTFVIVGAGPTGVELAGSLGEITRFSIQKDFHHITTEQTRILLVEGGPRVLSSMTPEMSSEAERELKELGVEVRTNSKVSKISDDGIVIGDEFIPASTVLWAAGVASNPINKTLDVGLDRQGRVIVQKDLRVPGFPFIFVIGDQAHCQSPIENVALPGLAPVAMQQGRFVGKIIRRTVEGREVPDTFVYTDKGQMATIGRSRAVAMYKGLSFAGFTAWMAWLLVHIYYLIGFKNRLFVLFQWSWTYLTYRRGARLIIQKDYK